MSTYWHHAMTKVAINRAERESLAKGWSLARMKALSAVGAVRTPEQHALGMLYGTRQVATKMVHGPRATFEADTWRGLTSSSTPVDEYVRGAHSHGEHYGPEEFRQIWGNNAELPRDRLTSTLRVEPLPFSQAPGAESRREYIDHGPYAGGQHKFIVRMPHDEFMQGSGAHGPTDSALQSGHMSHISRHELDEARFTRSRTRREVQNEELDADELNHKAKWLQSFHMQGGNHIGPEILQRERNLTGKSPYERFLPPPLSPGEPPTLFSVPMAIPTSHMREMSGEAGMLRSMEARYGRRGVRNLPMRRHADASSPFFRGEEVDEDTILSHHTLGSQAYRGGKA